MGFTQEEIARLRELADKAYPRPYISGPEAGFTAIAYHDHANGGWNNDALDGSERGEATGAYLVKAGKVLPAALDEIERLREAQKRLITASKAAYILIMEQIENMDDDDAGDVMDNLQTALKGGE